MYLRWRPGPGRARLSCAAPELGDALALKSLTVVASGFALERADK